MLHPGSVELRRGRRRPTPWPAAARTCGAPEDAFHFVWKKASGDLSLAADIAFVGAGNDPHRKACLMIRQSLDADSAYVDVALHGDGLTSLQFREAKGAATHEVQANVSAPEAAPDREAGQVRPRCTWRPRARSLQLLGRGRADRVRGAVLRRPRRLRAQQGRDREGGLLERRADRAARPRRRAGRSSTARSRRRRSPRPTAASSTSRPTRIEAPNWLRDGKTPDLQQRRPDLPHPGRRRASRKPIDTGFATRCNNDHGVSPDGTLLAISDQSQGDRQSLIYTLPVAGGTPKLVTPTGPSYWHGWSPDGKTLAYLRPSATASSTSTPSPPRAAPRRA